MKDCIIEALANPEKERMKHDDTTISSWLQSKYFIFPRMKFPSVVIAMLYILLPMLRAYLSRGVENT